MSDLSVCLGLLGQAALAAGCYYLHSWDSMNFSRSATRLGMFARGGAP